MGEPMTVKQVLEETMKIIGRINVPVELKEQIADPLSNARNNIALCVDAIARSEQSQAEPEQTEPEPEVQIEEIGG